MPHSDTPVINSPPKLLDQVRGKLRVKHYSIRTERAYVDWIKRYILFHGKQPLRIWARENCETTLVYF